MNCGALSKKPGQMSPPSPQTHALDLPGLTALMDGSLSYQPATSQAHAPACRPQPALPPGVRLDPASLSGQGPWILWTRLLPRRTPADAKNPAVLGGVWLVNDDLGWSANRACASSRSSRSRAADCRAVAGMAVNRLGPDGVIKKEGQCCSKCRCNSQFDGNACAVFHMVSLWMCRSTARCHALSPIKRRSFKNRAADKENPARWRGGWGRRRVGSGLCGLSRLPDVFDQRHANVMPAQTGVLHQHFSRVYAQRIAAGGLINA